MECFICGKKIDEDNSVCKVCSKVVKDEEIKTLEKRPNEYLNNIFKDNDIFDMSNFELIKDILIQKCGFLLIDKLEILRDFCKGYHHVDCSEGRIYSHKVILRNLIIDINPPLNLRDSSEISFTNCIFLSKVAISDNNKKLLKIVIDTCIFLQQLNLTSLDNMVDITIYRSNIEHLNIGGGNQPSQIGNLNVSTNKINTLVLTNASINGCFFSRNMIRTFEFDINNIEIIDFDYRQLDTDRLWRSYNNKLWNKVGEENKYNLFEFIGNKNDDIDKCRDKDIDEVSKIIKSLEFLRKFTKIEKDVEKYSDVLLLEGVLQQKNNNSKKIMSLLGCFVRPKRIIGIALGTILIFAGIYCFPSLVNCFPSLSNWIHSLIDRFPSLRYFVPSFTIGGVATKLSFSNALYFSGITFTTIGYGDICPTNITRILVVIEGLLGIIISSSLLTSLLRKYIH